VIGKGHLCQRPKIVVPIECPPAAVTTLHRNEPGEGSVDRARHPVAIGMRDAGER
jgi:hypothetical protein